jgi:hypothetical protein
MQLKSVMHAAPVDNEEAFHCRTVDACQTVRYYPDIFARMRRSMVKRVEARIGSHGGHFEYLLQMYSFSYNSQFKCFRTHVDMDFFVFWYVELVLKFCSHLSVTPRKIKQNISLSPLLLPSATGSKDITQKVCAKTELRVSSPQANYTDRATASYLRS